MGTLSEYLPHARHFMYIVYYLPRPLNPLFPPGSWDVNSHG